MAVSQSDKCIVSFPLLQLVMGILERERETTVTITGMKGQYLDILVENQGRINFGSGILNNSKVGHSHTFQ